MSTYSVPETVVAMLCGPHSSNDQYSPLFHRTNAAIRVAQGLCRTYAAIRAPHPIVPLLIAGDATGGRDVSLFAQNARQEGLEAIEVYDPAANTRGDVRAVLRQLATMPNVGQIEIVTDWWHMGRVDAWFRHLLPELLGPRSMEFRYHPVCTGPPPTEQQLRGECRGITDLLSGRAHQPFGPPIGKPDRAAIEAYDAALATN